MHLPEIEAYNVLIKASTLAGSGNWLDALRSHNKTISDQPKFKEKPFSEDVKKQKNTIRQEQTISKKEESILSNIKLNILLKSYLTTNLVLPLCDSNGSRKDFSDYIGDYRAYYIRRPTINRTSSSLLASQLELSVTIEGISVRFVRLLDTESKLRAAEPSLNEEAFKRLYNGAFYLINDKDEVMNTYTSKRVARLLASVPPIGSLQGMTFYGVYNQKASNTPYDELIPWAKNLKPKIDKYGNDVSDESGLIPFLAHSSSTENHHKNPGSGGQEWLYIEDRGLDGMLTYLCPTTDINQKVAKGISIKNTEMYDKDGNKIHAAVHPMAGLHLNTTSFNVANVNDFSSTSVLETIAKIALLN